MAIDIDMLREIIPGFLSFDCTALRATLSPASCATNWRERKIFACSECSIGAHHAGEEPRRPKKKSDCVRCGRTGGRLLSRSLCVSCYNRAREVFTGKNAKAMRPVLWGERLHLAHAIVLMETAPTPTDSTPRSPVLPIIERIDRKHFFVSTIVTSKEEMQAMFARLFDDHVLVDYEIFPPMARQFWDAQSTHPFIVRQDARRLRARQKFHPPVMETTG